MNTFQKSGKKSLALYNKFLLGRKYFCPQTFSPYFWSVLNSFSIIFSRVKLFPFSHIFDPVLNFSHIITVTYVLLKKICTFSVFLPKTCMHIIPEFANMFKTLLLTLVWTLLKNINKRKSSEKLFKSCQNNWLHDEE